MTIGMDPVYSGDLNSFPFWDPLCVPFLGSAVEDVEEGEHSFIAGGSANLYSQFGNQYGVFSENWESIYLKNWGSIYLKIQQYHSWAYIQRMQNRTTKTFVQLCS